MNKRFRILGKRNRKSGFALVGILVGSMVLLLAMAGLVKTIQSSYRAEGNVRQINDFDTIKSNVKAVLINEDRCKGAFRSAGDFSKVALYHPPTDPAQQALYDDDLKLHPGAATVAAPVPQPIQLGSIHLF